MEGLPRDELQRLRVLLSRPPGDGVRWPDRMLWRTVDASAARRRDPLPLRFSYTLRDPRHRGAYWAEIVDVKVRGGTRDVELRSAGGEVAQVLRLHGRTARVEVELLGSNEVRVQATNVARLRLLLSPGRFDLEGPVTVYSGRSTSVRTPQPSIATLLGEFRRSGDTQRLFPAVIEIVP